MLRTIVAALAAVFISTSAVASVDHRYENYGPVTAPKKIHKVSQQKRVKTVKRVAVRVAYAAGKTVSRGEVQLLPHPAGCPPRSFCGCGAAKDIYNAITGVVNGVNLRALWVANNWRKLFPVAEPAPGMVAVRRHHVFVIRKVLGPGRVLAYDANSGGRKTRLWERSLRGYSVHNPRGSKYAAAG